MEKSVSVRLSANVAQYVAAMKAAEASTVRMGGATQAQMTRVGAQMQNVGRKMTTFVSVPIAAAGAFAVKAAIDWESAWAGVEKTVDGTTEQMAGLEQGLRDMAKELPATHGEIAAVAEAAGALGVATEDIEFFTRVMIDLGETTDLTSDQAATGIAKMMNVMQSAPADVDNLGAALVHLGNNGASTESQILDMATRIAAAGSIVGLSESDVLGFANALASMGIEAEAGGSAFSRVITDIGKAVAQGGEDLDTFASVAGVSASAFATSFREDPAAAIVSFIDGLAGIHAAGGDVFTVLDELGLADVRVSRALLSMTTSGDLLTDSLQQGEQAWEANTALADEAAKRYDTAAARFEVVRNKIVDLFIDLGEIMLPAVEAVVAAIGFLAEKFQALPQPVQMAVGGFLALVAAMGPIVFIAGTYIKHLTQITKALKDFGPGASKASLALGGIGIALTAGFLVYQAFTDKQRELAARTDEVGAAMETTQGDVFRYALEAAGAETAVAGLAAAQAALSNALTQTGEDGAKLLENLGLLGRQSEEAADILIDLGENGVTALYRLAVGAGVPAAAAEELARAVAASDSQWDISQALMGTAGEAYIDVAFAMEEVQDQAEKIDLNEVATQGLAAAAASSELADQLIRQAEAEVGASRSSDQAVEVYQRYAEILATSSQATQDAILGIEGTGAAASGATGPLAALRDHFLGAAEGGEELEAVAASTIDTMSDLQQAYEDAQTRVGFYSDALGQALGNSRNWVTAHYDFQDALRGADEAINDTSGSLFDNTDAMSENRDEVFELADELIAMTEANINSGMSQEEVTREYKAGREALLDAAEAAGLNRDEVEDLIDTYGLTPELITTTMEIAGTALAEWRIQRHLEDLEDIPPEVATALEAAIDAGDWAEANRIIDEAARARDVPLRPYLTRTHFNIGVSGGQAGFSVGISASAAGRYVDRPMLSTLGERGDEVVLPLTDPGRMAALLGMSEVGPRVAAAMGSLMPFSAPAASGVDHSTSLSIDTINVGDRRDASPMVDALGKALFMAKHAA